MVSPKDASPPILKKKKKPDLQRNFCHTAQRRLEEPEARDRSLDEERLSRVRVPTFSKRRKRGEAPKREGLVLSTRLLRDVEREAEDEVRDFQHERRVRLGPLSCVSNVCILNETQRPS